MSLPARKEKKKKEEKERFPSFLFFSFLSDAVGRFGMKIFFHAEKIFWRFCDEFFFFYFSTSHVILTRVYIFRYFFFLYLPEIIHSFLCVFKKIINEFS